MHIDLMFPSRYLKAADLRGKDVVVTIRKIMKQDVRGKDGATKKEWHMYFDETKRAAERGGTEEKCYLFKITVARQIRKATGEPDGEKWIGKRITLYPTTCQSYGEVVDCIRVRETSPEPAAPAIESDSPTNVTATTEPGAQ